MGPRLDGRGDLVSAAQQAMSAWVWLQWGRGLMAAVTRRRIRVLRLASEASMGPRLDGRGDQRILHDGVIVVRVDASMGPRLDGRGDRWHRCAVCWIRCWLQWGRGLMAAVTLPIPVVEAHLSKLQWGRGLMAAVTPRRRGMQVDRDGASMGPRLDGRGDTGMRSGSESMFRASMGPRLDGRGDCSASIMSASTYFGGFNGAAA